jgi:light-regulated signal transduction histidine kinase (bacteriophytochrome)
MTHGKLGGTREIDSQIRDDWALGSADDGIALDMQYGDDIFGMLRRLQRDDSYPGWVPQRRRSLSGF